MAQIQLQHQVPTGSGSNAVAAAGQPSMVSLYVGDLDLNVTDAQLHDLFSQVASVVSVRVCKDMNTRESLGYGYVNFKNHDDAAKAMDILNYTPLNNKQIRIMYSSRDPSLRKSGTGNIFVKNLDKSIDNRALHDTFSSFGSILSCKVATDSLGQSRGYGFVQFDNEESAQNAIDNLNGTLLNEKQVFVGCFFHKNVRENTSDSTRFNNVYVRNLSELTTDEDLKKVFGEHGTITSVVVMRDGDGKSRCFGFVNFRNADDAARAVKALNGKKFGDKEWFVGKAQKKSEREQELKEKFEQSMKQAVDKPQGNNLYVKNLDDSIDDEKLRKLFSDFGAVTSCEVMLDPSGISKGAGFVAFSTAEEASRALAGMNGKLLIRKPLYVALAQKKEERRARLQAQFSHMRPGLMPSSASLHVPVYSGAQGLGQQLLYGQAPSSVIPQQQELQGQGPVGHFGPSPVHQMQQQCPLIQQHKPRLASASVLVNTTPEQQRMMLGESLYPLVEQLDREGAAKVTGMLQEMEQIEVLHLLESPAALKAKVVEAIEVLRNVESRNTAIQQSGLSLSE